MKVSVVLPVYNAENTISAALDSLQADSLAFSEVIVINDGSTDTTRDILRARSDIVLLDHSHRGIVPALNDGLAAAKGDYIARMDADDLCHPERLARQAAYLDTHPEVDLVGCRVKFGGDRSTHAGYAAYVDWINRVMLPADISLNRFVESPFAHPSVMFRRATVEAYGGYRDGPFPEDYELWLRWLDHGIRAAKVDAELMTWNDPPSRLSRTDERYSIDSFYETKAEYLVRWLAQQNPHHPNVVVWGAGRVTRRRAAILARHGLHVSHYVDLKPRRLECGTPVIHHDDLPPCETSFVLSMVGNRGAREQIRRFLLKKGFVEGVNCLFAA